MIKKKNNSYNHQKIEAKWQKHWSDNNLYQTKNTGSKPKCYVLDMFPYPSGDGLHVGHIKGYTATDIYARFKRMNGFNVLHPMGWDAFGLPAENYALKNKVNPAISTKKNIDNFRRQLKSLGFSYDWSREINTTDPDYYHWTQWIFLQLYKKGLAYESFEPINWCPSCQTGLANEDLENNRCERCGSLVEKKPMRQWVLKITDYADRLLADLDSLDWPESVKESQRHWIGRSFGAEISFPIKTKYKYVLIHGWRSSGTTTFFPWLKKELEARGHEVIALDLPDPYLPNIDVQADYLLSQVDFDEKTIIIGHSLGSVVSYRILEKLNKPINKLILVAGLIEPRFRDKERWAAKILLNWQFDLAKIRQNAGRITILEDLDDSIIAKGESLVIQKALGGEVHRLKAHASHFCDPVEPAILEHSLDQIKVFTTRADTLFGATYLVLSPEHPLLRELAKQIENLDEVKTYIKQAGQKTEIERTNIEREKTGVCLKGLTAIHPATGDILPVWVADYVLADYGSGAIMAVPAHDERDRAFAQKYKLPIKEVIMPERIDKRNPPVPGKEKVERQNVHAIVFNPKNKRFLCLKWKKHPWTTFPMGGVEAGEEIISAARREVLEETGYQNLSSGKILGGQVRAEYFAAHKNQNRISFTNAVYFELKDEEREVIAQTEEDEHSVYWADEAEINSAIMTHAEMDIWLSRLKNSDEAYQSTGILINSSQFNGLDSETAKKKIVDFVKGKLVTKYRLRDWVFSRQRYWGEPIPIIHCSKCGVVPVPEKDLPVKLPMVKQYAPTGTGESPLAAIDRWVKVKCPICQSPAKRETNTMPQWAGSSWYYLRFIDPHQHRSPADPKKTAPWLPVDVYVGGVEHATRHLIYARFWHKFLYDLGRLKTPEPFLRLKNQGLISGADGRKMSKRWGNVVNPDDVIRDFGADTLRLYEMFMGPFDQGSSWQMDNLMGPRRLLERIWRLADKVKSQKTDHQKSKDSLFHQTIKQINDDIEQFNHNTAISALMILVNDWDKRDMIMAKEWADFLKLLAPFAPHLAEELWQQAGQAGSIHLATWPKYDPAILLARSVNLVVQINGKVRETITAPAEISEEEALVRVLELPLVKKWLDGAEPKKVIFIPGRLINLVT